MILSKDLKGFSNQGVLFHTILTDLGSAQTVRGNKVYSISIISRERLMRKTFSSSLTPGARFSKVPIINGPGKLSPFTSKIEVSIVLHLT